MRPEQFLEYPSTSSGPSAWPFLTLLGGSYSGGASVEEALRPLPHPDGSLHQDPDFTLPSEAGPITWALHWNSQQVARPSVWGYGRRSSLDLTLTADVNGPYIVASVQHENGNLSSYRSVDSGATFVPVTGTVGSLVKNGDGSWDETRGDSGYRYHFPAGNAVQVAY